MTHRVCALRQGEKDMERKRSIGVTFVGWYLIVTSITGIVSNAILLIAPPDALLKTYAQIFKYDPLRFTRITAAASLVLSVLTIFLGINILRLKETWRRATFYYCIFMVIYIGAELVFLAKDPVRLLELSLLSIILYGALGYFVTRPAVKEQCRSPGTFPKGDSPA